MILEVFNKGAPEEEAKGDSKNSKRARAIIDGLEQQKSSLKNDKGFRSFLKTQKLDAMADEVVVKAQPPKTNVVMQEEPVA